MADLFSRGMAWLAQKQKKHLSRPVAYERADPDGGPPRLIHVHAVLGQSAATGNAVIQPLRIDAAAVDFLIPADDLVLDGRRVEPRADDRIIMFVKDLTCIYEILPRGKDGGGRGNTPWRWSDPQQTIRRIHSRLVEEHPTAKE